jgi:hypothetical protein
MRSNNRAGRVNNALGEVYEPFATLLARYVIEIHEYIHDKIC